MSRSIKAQPVKSIIGILSYAEMPRDLLGQHSCRQPITTYYACIYSKLSGGSPGTHARSWLESVDTPRTADFPLLPFAIIQYGCTRGGLGDPHQFVGYEPRLVRQAPSRRSGCAELAGDLRPIGGRDMISS